MALPPPSGSSQPDLNVNNVPNEVPKTQRDLLANMPMAMDSNLNRPAIDASAYPKTALLLAGFLRGMKMRVTYYAQQRQGGSNDQTALTDYPAERDTLSTEYYRFLNMQIVLQDNLQFSFDGTKASSEINYRALFYPGKQPNTGDKMIYELGPGQLVILTVNLVEPLSPYQDTAYAISFSVQSFADSTDMAALNGSTTKTFVWTETVNYGTPYSVLTQDSYLLLQFITAFRSELINYYFETFYDDRLNSFVRPDGAYDPTCVRFMVNKISIRDTGRRCAILYRDIDTLYAQSIWGRLGSRYRANMNALSTTYFITTAQADGFSAFFNELYDRYVILPKPYQPIKNQGIVTLDRGISGYLYAPDWEPVIIGPTGWITPPVPDVTAATETYYAFSKAFWEKDLANMSPTEAYLYGMILNRIVPETSPDVLKDYFNSVYDMDNLTQYYTIPVMIHMIDMLKRTIPDVVNAATL